MLMKINGDRHFAGCGGIVRQTDPADAAEHCGDRAHNSALPCLLAGLRDSARGFRPEENREI